MREISSSVLISYHNRSKSTGPCKSNVYICTYEPPVERKKKEIKRENSTLVRLSAVTFFFFYGFMNFKFKDDDDEEGKFLIRRTTNTCRRKINVYKSK